MTHDVLIAGGGIIGCSIALELCNRGFSVVVLEAESSLFRRSSGAGFGSLTPYSDPFFRGRARDFAAWSVDLYRESWLPALSGPMQSIDIGDKGLLDLLVDKDAVDRAEILQKELHEANYQAVMMTRQDVIALEPSLTGLFEGALWLDEPWVDRDQLFTSIAAKLESAANVSICCLAEVVSVTEGISGVTVKTKDDSFSASYFVHATGLSARSVDGVELPQLTWVRGDAVSVRHPDGYCLLERHVYKNAAFITPRRDGRLLLGATYEAEDRSPELLETLRRDTTNVSQIRHLIDVNLELVPEIDRCEFESAWRGWRPKPVDGLPILGFGPGGQRIIFATGFIGLGITMAPAAGVCVADLIAEGSSAQLPAEFDPLRFTV